MRVLLDESLSPSLCRALEGHEVVTVPKAGRAGMKYGELPRLAGSHFDVVVIPD